MSSNQDPTKLSFFQKRKVVTEIGGRLSHHQQDVIENEVDSNVKSDALDGIDRSRVQWDNTRKAVQPIPYFFQRPEASKTFEIQNLENTVESRHKYYKRKSSEAAQGRTSNRIDPNQSQTYHDDSTIRPYEQPSVAQPLTADPEYGEPTSLMPPPRKTGKAKMISVPEDAQTSAAVATPSLETLKTLKAKKSFKRGHKHSGTFGQNIDTAEYKNE
ncbi:hypothetical protein HYPSUDRAFT_213938 [Hypholoma sublateritium FD-334 SS-4]|uniref:Uncharacterized protein n=1 Tax=Hypholoma sublateritium (strain FD-334 SS-4) TaxID=945553 RepID=A0A0D2LDY9_HYPSF|nr:hypothetical protein HYPSUDRAFT_213938 [Hypholoma sublateritium FD-334 SS-4]